MYDQSGGMNSRFFGGIYPVMARAIAQLRNYFAEPPVRMLPPFQL